MTASDEDSRRQRICATVDAIPPGSVATYGQVAREAGLPGRARLVGRFLGELPTRSELPWHRVLGANGQIRPRPGGGPSQQRRRLEREGVTVSSGGKVNLAVHGWCAGK